MKHQVTESKTYINYAQLCSMSMKLASYRYKLAKRSYNRCLRNKAINPLFKVPSKPVWRDYQKQAFEHHYENYSVVAFITVDMLMNNIKLEVERYEANAPGRYYDSLAYPMD